MDKSTIEGHFKDSWESFYRRYIPGLTKAGEHEHKALCPFHEEKKPSFYVNSQTGAYYCHSCGKKGHAFHLYAKLNQLDDRRDFPKILKGIAQDFGIQADGIKPRFVKAYDYTDENGSLLFQVCRYEPKTFKQRVPDGKGGWRYNLNGTRRVLYNLSEVLRAETVLFVEGEKDAETARELGITATTSPMGASSWRDEYAQTLEGKTVILCPDNDQAGKNFMSQVETSLAGIAKTIKRLDLPGLSAKGDLSDWAQAQSDKDAAAERLAVMMAEAPEIKPEKALTIEDVVFDDAAFRIMDLPSKIKLLDPILSEQQIILISGWRGVGKSWCALSIGDALTRGLSFGPWTCIVPAPCLYVDAEMAAEDVRDRIKSLNPQGEPRQAPLLIYCDSYAHSKGLPRANLLHENWRQSIMRIVKTRHVKVLILDNIASLAPGIDENAKKDWDPVNQWLLALRFEGVSTLLLHHTNKDGGQRGTSAREDNLDLSIILKQPPDYVPEDGADFIMHFSKARVKHDDLPLIQDCRFTLRKDDNGGLTWEWGYVKAEVKREVLRMLADGIPATEIAQILGISKGRVSQIKKESVTDINAGKDPYAG